ncbi:MAG: hypothetical protein ACM3VZ_09925 [Acidobacteriota bacterium]
MKRQPLRQAQQLLTLSLMGSLALLAACGGGGKNEPAAAAPQAVVVVDKTVAQAADPDEPYLVAPSGFTTAAGSTNLTLNVINGITQEALLAIDLGATTGVKQWTVADKWVKSDTKVTYVPASLFYIKGKQLFRTSLSRTDDPTVAQRLSNSSEVCTIESTYPLQHNNTDAALLVTIADGTHACGSASDRKAIITTLMTADSSPIAPPTQTFKVLQNLYGDDGILKGILVEKPNSSGTAAQLASWSPTMDAEQTPLVTLKDASTPPNDYSVYALRAGNPAFGAQWVTNLPATRLAGYARVKVVFSAAVPAADKTPAKPEVTVTHLFQVKWADGGVTASVVPGIAMDDTAATTLGVSDSTAAYFMNGPDLVVAKPSPAPLVVNPLEPLNALSTFKVTAMTQSAKRVLLTVESNDEVQVLAVNKSSDASTGLVGLGRTTSNFKFLGVHGEAAYAQMTVENGAIRVFKSDMDKIPTDGSQAPILTEPALYSIWPVGLLKEQSVTLSTPELSGMLVCEPGLTYTPTCFRKTIKLFSFATNAYTQEIGKVEAVDARQGAITGGQYGTLSNYLTAELTLITGGAGKFDVRRDVFAFHPAAPRSLKLIGPPTPDLAASGVN